MSITTWLGKNIWVTVIYIVTAQVGQYFSIPPGNITAVWIPSGLMLHFVFCYGYNIWPGIFFGALLGNSWAYADFSSLSAIANTILAGTCNGAGDVLSAVGGIMLYRKISNSLHPLESFFSYRLFVLCCGLLGPLCSAIIGTTSLFIAGFLTGTDFSLALLTWWIGDSVGAIVLPPALIAACSLSKNYFAKFNLWESILFAISLATTCYLAFFVNDWPQIVPSPLYAIAVIVLWSIFRFGQFITFAATLIVCIVAIIGTSLNRGFFASGEEYLSLIHLQASMIFATVIVFVLSTLVDERRKLIDKLETQARMDFLTGIFNRSYMVQQIDAEIYKTKRYGTSFAIMMFDIDDFKQINDDFGHHTGDEVLISVAHTVKQTLRESDLLARWGGEEFIALLSQTTTEGAYTLAERCRENILKINCGNMTGITCSFGISKWVEETDAESLINQADQAMYISKVKGKNRTTVYPQSV
jgi:diguanylate cyclase (GGDEF)-like protein